MKKKEKLVLLIPALWTSFIDTTVTIAGQPKDYWNGNLQKANEANPIGQLFMQNHVSGIFILCGAWIITIGFIGYYLPQKLSRIFLLFVLIAHSYGASTWLTMNYGFLLAMLFIAFNSILFYKIQDISKQTT
nr:hypothetical protein [uncultured Carboxylicivirga sp.]